MSENGSANGVVKAAKQDLDVFFVSENDVTISRFTMQGATEFGFAGVCLLGVSYCHISGNNVTSNGDGISILKSHSNLVANNMVANNNWEGIFLDFSSDNTLTSNTASNNTWYGIYMTSSSNNTIYNNYFNNTNNAYDDGYNTWNTTPGTNIIGGSWLGGNYWYDYAGADTNGGDYHPLVTPSSVAPNITSSAPESPVNDTYCTWTKFNVSADQTVNVTWYLNGTPQTPKNESVTDANYTFHAEYIGENNVSAVAENVNGTAMRKWIWNVTAAPAPAPPSPVNDIVCHWRTFNVTVNQTVNVSWYLNNSPLHTNVSTKEANYTLHAEVVGEHNISAVASNDNGTDMQTWVWNVDDGDGVSGDVEDDAPGGGDGNGDGIPDRTQPNVTSLPTVTNQRYMTLVLSNCSQLQNVTALTESPTDPDYYYHYPYGLVSFEIMCENGTVEIIYQTDLTGYTYRKYGPTTPGNPETTKWYDFSTYATIAGNRVTLSFQDDRLGDNIGGDGKIVDPGGLGIPGAVAQVPVLTPVGMLALIAILRVVLAVATSRKRREY